MTQESNSIKVESKLISSHPQQLVISLLIRLADPHQL
jgi:hypothetical protein